ncbi:MAG: dihydroorotate dehydrogenase (quinone) [Campylobacteraceae bacterium 4484_166]|nr:MAG: dihydroorotate dehydrogenase (quinone) [Campylobacteraceae bacterium 4484_166]
MQQIYLKMKKIIFLFSPETAHTIVEFLLKILPHIKPINNWFVKQNYRKDEILTQNIFNKTIKNPIGLAAGFDKNGDMINSMKALGFSFTEVGTITKKAQSGNPKPRVFRHIASASLQNGMGFNNKGSNYLYEKLDLQYPNELTIGVSLGKNKTTKEEHTIEEYLYLIEKFHKKCDYLAINISSPNTPALRDLQNENFIRELFVKAKKITNTPILLKLSADLDETTALSLCEVAITNGASGIIATNTSIDYSLLSSSYDFGGLSGEVIKEKSHKLFKAIGKKFYNKTTLIAVGGISTAQDAYDRIKAGASLVQLFTSLIYKGPTVPKDINDGLIKLLKDDNYTNISQAVGADFK